MTLKEGQSTTRPPLLEGSNYASCKPKMKSFLKSLDEWAWKAVLTRWTEPKMENLTGEAVPKPEALWTEADDKASMGNSKAMNAIFSGVDENVMKLIINCEVAKEAWDILQIAYEGTDKVRNSRMQIVTTKFETMKMKDSETIPEFNARVLDLSNEAAALGKPIDEERMAAPLSNWLRWLKILVGWCGRSTDVVDRTACRQSDCANKFIIVRYSQLYYWVVLGK
ncbi:unnamed protein product [Rhodiola kirilowii]